MATTLDKQTLADLIDGKLGWSELHEIMSSYKDADRFDKYVEVLQARVPWPERILLPLGPHLYIVRRSDGGIVTKSDSGFEFGDYRENWKLKARMFVRDSDATYEEIYPKLSHAHPDWMELREFYDPIDGTLLWVDAVPPGYPIVHNFLPELDGFYREWLGRDVP